MIDQVQKLFAADRKKPATSTQIEKAIDDVAEELTRKRDELETLTKQRSEILLTASDEKTVDQHERTLELVSRDVTRLTLVKAQLAEELGKASDREAKSDQDKLIRAAHRDHDRGVKLLEELAEPARRCVELLEELKTIEARIDRARRAAERFGRRNDCPSSPNHSVRPRQRNVLDTFCIPRLTDDAPCYAPDHLVHGSDVMRWERPPEPRPQKRSTKKREAGVYNADGERIDHHAYDQPPRGYRHTINRGIQT